MITVRLRTPADDAVLARLFQEMQAHYEVPCPPVETILADLVALPAGVTILVAEEQERIVGLVTFSVIYPGPGLASGLFVKDLFVAKDRRQSGIGTNLMRAVAAFAIENGHRRVDWTAARDNPALLEYYDGFGAVRQEDKVFFRLMGDALKAAAKRDFSA